jgi:lipopolysaccharide transport system permease protein
MIAALREIWLYRELLVNITAREFRVRYKQSFLGGAWAVVQPFSLTLIFLFVSKVIRNLPSDGKPYALFAAGALMQWTFFANSLSLSIPSLVGNSALVKKIYFPREVLPIATVIVSFVDFCIAFVVLIGLLAFYRVTGRYEAPFSVNLLWMPVILVIQIMLTLGVSFFLSAINVTYRDVKHTVPLLLQLWLFASPVVYSAAAVKAKSEALYRAYMLINPMAPLITSYRTVLLDGALPDLAYLGTAAAISAVLCAAGYAYFKRVDSLFADIL